MICHDSREALCFLTVESTLITHPVRQKRCEISAEELWHIRHVIEHFPKLSRKVLAQTLSEHFHWYSPSGALKVQKCQQLLERLAEQKLIVLPAKHISWKRGPDTPPRLTERTKEQAPLRCPLSKLASVELVLLTDKADIACWNEYVERYHPLGHKRPFGNWLRYFVYAANTLLGCIFMSGAAKALHHRDEWIGWRLSQRRRNLPWVINNSRYLLFPWVHVPHLASHVLGKLAKQVAHDWEHRWGYRPVLMETFVDPQYNGTCYRAAGWHAVGMTRGEGKPRPGKPYTTCPKHIFVKPLHPEFQSLLTSKQLQGRIIE